MVVGSLPDALRTASDRLRAHVEREGFALRLDVEARVPLNRPEFTVENLGVVHAAWPVAVSGTLGVEARFP